MIRLYKWSLGFFIFSFILGFIAAMTKDDLQTFFGGFCLVSLVASGIFLMVGYFDDSSREREF